MSSLLLRTYTTAGSIPSGDIVRVLQTKSSSSMRTCAFSPDGQFMACGGDEGKLNVYHVADLCDPARHTVRHTCVA